MWALLSAVCNRRQTSRLSSVGNRLIPTRRQIPGRLAACVGGLVITVAIIMATGGAASAHAFLVSSDPPQGARLADPPSVLTLRFTEAVVLSATSVTVRVTPGSEPIPASVSSGGDAEAVRVGLAESPAGIYQVSWQTVSADDGHASAGEFAFAAGRVGGTIPAAAQATAGSSETVGVIGTALFLLGLAAALGGALTALVVDPAAPGRRAGTAAGLLSATAGAAISLLNDLARAHGSRSHASMLTAVALGLVAAAMFADARTRRPAPVLVASTAAGVAWAGLSHPAIMGGVAGLAVNAVHLVVGAAWAGSLGYLLISIVAWRSDRDKLRAGAARYARMALPMVVALAVAGGVSALEVLPSWSSLYTSGYGQMILVKSGLFAAALALAVIGRRRGLRAGRTATLAATVPIEALAVTAVLVVSAVLANTAPPVKALPLDAVLGPPPLNGPAARAAGMAGQLTVGVAALSGQLEIQLTAPDSSPLVSARVEIDAYPPGGGDIGLSPRPCGPGCFTQHYALPAGITRLVISAAASRWAGGHLTADLAWPPPARNPGLLERAVEVMDAQPRVTTRETVTSNTAGPSYTTTLPPTSGRQLVALQPYGGGSDEPGETASVTDVRPVAVGGPGLQLYLPGVPVWVTIWLDPQGRIARQQIVSIGHLITDTYHYG